MLYQTARSAWKSENSECDIIEDLLKGKKRRLSIKAEDRWLLQWNE